MIKKIGIIGYGSWATALVKILSHNNIQLVWHFPKQEDIDYIQTHHHSPRYLTDVELNLDVIELTTSLDHLSEKSDTIVLAYPSAFLHKTIQSFDFNDKSVFSAIKGIVPEYNLIIGEYLNQIHKVPLNRIGVITGPCHAEEVALERLSYLTIAGQNQEMIGKMCRNLTCHFIQTTASDDIYGTEYSAVLKNIMAVAAGICHGLGYGDNFQAVLISNAIQEIKKFVDAVHPINRDINDSAYLGDLLVTAYSQFSRNRTFGNMIGKGYSVKQTQLEMNMVAEGYYALQCIYQINQTYKVDMPITNAVYQIIFGSPKKSAQKAIQELTRNLK